MQPAINTQSTARNFPCCSRYVLHVSQIMRETLLMDLCTGRFFVRWYCHSPNIAPTAHMTMPRYISVTAAHAAQPVERDLVKAGNFQVRLARVQAGRLRQKAL
jgi:hypothetical protein